MGQGTNGGQHAFAGMVYPTIQYLGAYYSLIKRILDSCHAQSKFLIYFARIDHRCNTSCANICGPQSSVDRNGAGAGTRHLLARVRCTRIRKSADRFHLNLSWLDHRCTLGDKPALNFPSALATSADVPRLADSHTQAPGTDRWQNRATQRTPFWRSLHRGIGAHTARAPSTSRDYGRPRSAADNQQYLWTSGRRYRPGRYW